MMSSRPQCTHAAAPTPVSINHYGMMNTCNRMSAMTTPSVRLSLSAAPRTHPALARASPRSAPARGRAALRCVAATATPSPLVKVCGVMRPEDAAHAASSGADYVGMILWPDSKRSIDASTAKEVIAAAREAGAEPVGVFVSENAEQINEMMDILGLTHCQLHGDQSRTALAGIPNKHKVIYVMNANSEGKIVTPLPGDEMLKESNEIMVGATAWRKASDWVSRGRRTVEYILVDGMNAGSGEKFDWHKLKVPKGASRLGWALAGGLNPDNVAEAVSITRPTLVDVSSGVCDASGLNKDPAKVLAFIENARAAALVK